MEDDVAEKLEADIILPASSVKPEYKGPSRLVRWLTGGARTFRGPVVLGIREVSRPLTFESSYTLIEHAGRDSIEMEVKPHTSEQAAKLRAAVDQRDFQELFRLLGTSESQRVYHADAEVEPAEGGYTGVENTIVEAVLKADAMGSPSAIPGSTRNWVGGWRTGRSRCAPPADSSFPRLPSPTTDTSSATTVRPIPGRTGCRRRRPCSTCRAATCWWPGTRSAKKTTCCRCSVSGRGKPSRS